MRFSNPEKLKQLVFDPEKKKPYTLEDVELQTIPCSYEEIEKYATLIYQGMKSSYLTLSGPNNHGVRISISGYPYLAIWTAKKNAPFICLEPWYGHADFSRVEEDFSHREGTMTLSAGKHSQPHIQFRYFKSGILKKQGYAESVLPKPDMG